MQDAFHTMLSQFTQLLAIANTQGIIILLFNILVIFVIARFFSKFACSLLPRLFWSLFGLSLLSTIFQNDCICLTGDAVVGAGFIAPHITYFLNYILQIVFKVQAITINTYYIFITIWYKIVRFFSWIVSPLSNIRFKRARDNNHYSRTNNRYNTNSNSNRRTKNNNYEKEYQEYTKKHYSNHQNSSSNNTTHTQIINNNNTEDMETKLQNDPKYSHFFSNSAYIVLDVDDSMNLKEIRKKYRDLLKIYHPDKNRDNTTLATIITQRLNWAYGKLESM